MKARFPDDLIRKLLRLFPSRVRQSREAELEDLYRDMWQEMAPRKLSEGLRFRVHLLLDLLSNAGCAWWREILGGGLFQGDGSVVPSQVISVATREARIALRRLLRTPGFTLVAVLTMALGIAANTVVFTLISGVYLKPLPFPDPDRLVYLKEANDQILLGTSYDAYRYFGDEVTTLEEVGAFGGTSLILQEGGDPVRLEAARVSANLFPILGIQPFQGRGFLPAEDDPEAEKVIILSHATWQSHFGGRPNMLGSRIRMSDGSYTVVGIMSPEVHFPSETVQGWVTLRNLTREPSYRALTMVGRLAVGVSLESAGEEVMTIGRRLEEENGPAKGGEFTYAYPLEDRLVDPRFQTTLTALAIAVAFLLLIAGANLTNLLLARASTRKAEVVVRKALGASRWRLALTGVAEPLVLSLASGIIGIGGAWWGAEFLLRAAPTAIPRHSEIGLDPRVLLFALILTLGMGLAIGLASLPWTRKKGLAVGVQSGGRVSRGRPLQGVFTVVQVALTFALLAGVSLMARTVLNLQAVDVGFEPSEAYIVNIGLSPIQHPDGPSRLAFHDQVVEQALGLRRVSAAGYASFLPLDGGWNDTGVLFEENPAPMEELPTLEYDLATPGFFDAMGIALRRGRLLEDGDREGTLKVAVINETAARLHFPDGVVLGRRLAPWASPDGGPDWLTVVGVVEDVRHHHIAEPTTPKFYIPFSQFGESWPYGLNMVIRTAGPEIQGAQVMIREMIRDLGAGSPLVEISPLQAQVDRFVEGPRFNALLLGIFTSAALGLAALGLYGVVAFGVSERRKEIGLRMALGAHRGRIRRETLWRGIRLTLVGILTGIPLALVLGRVMANMLFGVGSYDSGVLAGVMAFLAGVSALACLLPSFRASRIDPMVSLRQE